MTISDVCIKRPVFTWVLVAIPVVLGLVSYDRLGVDLFPNVDFPVCTVTTVLAGRERRGDGDLGHEADRGHHQHGLAASTSCGRRRWRGSRSSPSSSCSRRTATSGTQEVRDKVNTILADLPDGTEPPIIDKFDTGSMPVMTIAVSGRRDFREVTELARKQIKERLETVNGVGAITLVGGRIRAMNVVVDTDKLAGLQPLDRGRADGPRCGRTWRCPAAGSTRGRASWSSGRSAGSTPRAEFNDLIVANRNGYPIRIRDIGRAEDSFEEPRTLARLDGDNAVSLVVQKQSGTNTVKVVDDVKARLERAQGRAAARHRRPRSSATSRGSSGSRSRK